MESNYIINYGIGMGNEKTDTLEEAMKLADENATYTGMMISIEDEFNGVIAHRTWCGCRDGIEEQENPIDFGDFGYYADWDIE